MCAGALLLANVMRGRMRALCTEALRSWYDAALHPELLATNYLLLTTYHPLRPLLTTRYEAPLLQQQPPGVWREGGSSQGWHEELSRAEEDELYEGLLSLRPPPNGQGS